jgi:hypothetical protein
MDLSTAKGKLNQYENIHEALGDLRLIWQNCKYYNQEGSDIYKNADEFETIMELLVKVGYLYIYIYIYIFYF